MLTEIGESHFRSIRFLNGLASLDPGFETKWQLADLDEPLLLLRPAWSYYRRLLYLGFILWPVLFYVLHARYSQQYLMTASRIIVRRGLLRRRFESLDLNRTPVCTVKTHIPWPARGQVIGCEYKKVCICVGHGGSVAAADRIVLHGVRWQQYPEEWCNPQHLFYAVRNLCLRHTSLP